MLVVAGGANVEAFRADPIVAIATFFTNKTIWPFYHKQIIVVCVRVRKT